MIQKEGLLTKTDARFIDKFTIDSHLSNGNYIVRDINGDILKGSYPLHKFKIIKDEDAAELDKSKLIEIEHIIDDRKVGSKSEYMVKWKNFDDLHNEWLDKSKFTSTEIIHNFHKIKNKSNKNKNIVKLPDPIVQSKKKRGSPPASSYLLSIICF